MIHNKDMDDEDIMTNYSNCNNRRDIVQTLRVGLDEHGMFRMKKERIPSRGLMYMLT